MVVLLGQARRDERMGEIAAARGQTKWAAARQSSVRMRVRVISVSVVLGH
jgi:hypothetical protein